jgi:ATP-dependent Clp protease ATP-binding subunit ClpB
VIIKGRTIDFKNTIIMLTSNSKNPEMDFKPEVLGRLDARLEYNSLGEEVMHDLVNKEIALLQKRVKDKNITIEFDQEVKDHVAKLGYDEKFGARPLSSVFKRIIIRPLSKLLLKGEMDKSSYHFSLKDSEVVIS